MEASWRIVALPYESLLLHDRRGPLIRTTARGRRKIRLANAISVRALKPPRAGPAPVGDLGGAARRSPARRPAGRRYAAAHRILRSHRCARPAPRWRPDR